MPSRTYVETRLGALAGLLKVSDLAGFRLEPHPHFRVRDRYFDTDDGELLRRGLCLRVREKDGDRRALLRPIRPEDDGPTVEVPLESADRIETLNPLRDVLVRVTNAPEPPPLHSLLSLRQDRTPRAAYDGNRFVGLLSFDVVVFELPDGPHVSNELDIELAQSGTEADLHTLDPFLRSVGLEMSQRTKVERGIVQIPRRVTQPLLLLPHERDVLESVIASGSALHQRRARVLLLDARGFRSATIANQLGLSTARVRHWKQLFREQRLGVFEGAESVEPAESVYTVSEWVSGVPDGPFVPTEVPDPVPAAEAPDAEPEIESSGDGASTAFTELQGGIDDLLDLFQPRPTDTPLLTDLEDEPAEVEGAQGERPPADEGATVNPPEAPTPRNEDESTEAESSASGEPPVSREARPIMRRPRVHPDDSLVAAAHDVLAYHVGQVGWCAADLNRDRGPYRLYLAIHRVRLSLEVFAPVLPTASVKRLHQGLRRLAVALAEVLELERAVSAESVADRSEALAEVHALLEGSTFEDWCGRAERLVEQLAAQRDAGERIPDDAPLPWDDYLGDVDDQPARSQVRHILGTALWTRVEAVWAWSPDGESPEETHAYPLALACSGVRFVLGLAEQAAPEAVRLADGMLEEVEARWMRTHRGEADEMADAWQRFRSEALRAALADVLCRL